MQFKNTRNYYTLPFWLVRYYERTLTENSSGLYKKVGVGVSEYRQRGLQGVFSFCAGASYSVGLRDELF